MGSGGCANDVLESKESCGNLDKALERQKDGAEPQVELGPITPEADRENGECQPMLFKKPSVLAVNTNSVLDDTFGLSVSSSSPKTPEVGVFDPFAPGPEKLAMAPTCNKFVSKSMNVVARQLSFDSAVEVSEDEISTESVESLSDEEIFEVVYESLLEAIVSDLTLTALSEHGKKDWSRDEECTTPPGTRLNGIVETCPGAPMRPGGKSRKIDLSLIRKLEF